MFENLFTIYNSLDPPPIPRITEEVIPDIKIPILSLNIKSNNDFITEPLTFEETSFEKSINEPIKLKSSVAQKAVDLARTFVGDPYHWGGKSPKTGFDCSGLIGYVYKLNGVDIPSTTFELFKTGKEVPSLSEVLVGDIICTPGSGRTGKHVKLVSKVEDGLIYTIEAKGRNYGIVETPLEKTNNIITIRRITEKPKTSSNYETLRFNYIKLLENPNNVGFNGLIWTPPKGRGYDSRGIGIGLDMYTNTKVKNFLSSKGRTLNPWLSNSEMLSLLNSTFTDLENTLNKHTKSMRLSNTKRVIAIGLLYHGYGPKLWEQGTKLHNAFFNGSDKDFINTVTEFYSNKYPTRARSHANFWNV